MRTNGLVWAVALSLSIAGSARAAELMADEAKKEADTTPAVSSDVTTQECCDGDVTYCSCEPCQSCHCYAGTEFSFLNINSWTGGRITASFSDTTAPDVATTAFNEFSGVDDWGFAPRVWVGNQINEHWGVEARYWNLDDNEQHAPDRNPNIPTTGTNFATFESYDRLSAYTIDIEGVYNCTCNGWKMDSFLGCRDASINMHSGFLGFGVFTTGNFINLTLQNGCSMDAAGPTYGGIIRHQIGSSHANFFLGVRGSTLWGHSNSFGRSDGTVASSPSAPLVGAATVTRNGANGDLNIVESQVGVQWEIPLQCMPATYFFRAAYEYQSWDLIAPPTGGAGFGGTIGEITVNSFASAGIGRLNLDGISLATGLTW